MSYEDPPPLNEKASRSSVDDARFAAVLGPTKQEGNQSNENTITNPVPGQYRLYRRRFSGLVALIFLNIAGAMSWPWFGPISNDMVAEFHFTLREVNWLGNIVGCVYLPTALIIPSIISRFGIRRCCDVGAVALVLSAWIRFAGTALSLSPGGGYALLFLGQFLAAIAQPMYQVIGPIYSETWFDLKGRTTATMVIAISNPLGGALGQLISPLVGDTRRSILVLGIIVTAIAPLVLLVGTAPPTPPTFAGSKNPPSLRSLCDAMLGRRVGSEEFMTVRERLDFAIVAAVSGVLIGVSVMFSILTAQIFEPMGYSSDISGLMGACLLLSGIVSAIITAPILDRVLTHRLGLASKLFVPFIAVGWFVLIWAVRPGNTAGLFIIMAVIGIFSVPMLPIGMELACEVTRNADGSAALIWFTGNLFGIIFVLSSDALRAGLDASPPQNMKKALIFVGTVALVISSSIFFLKGKERRKEMDEEQLQQSLAIQLDQRT